MEEVLAFNEKNGLLEKEKTLNGIHRSSSKSKTAASDSKSSAKLI